MAKSKGGKSKSQGSLVEMLLKRAETIAIVVAVGGLAILLLSGVFEGLSAKNAEEHAKPLVDGAQTIQSRITNGEEKPPPLESWVNQLEPSRIDPSKFVLLNHPFDPAANPNFKRENPQVLGIEKPQVDLIRAPMLGYDVYVDAEGKPWIGVLTKRTVSPNDQNSLKGAMDELLKRKPRRPVAVAAPMGPVGVAPMGVNPMGGGTGANGVPSQTFDANSKREETAIEYIPLDSLDKSKKSPALTLIPLRLSVIQATFPLKRQIEEMQRALRLKSPDQVARFGPVFDGFEVRRQIYGPIGRDGKMPVLQPMDEYKFEEKFAEIIDSRVLGYHLDSGFLPYFLRFEEGLAWPLPRLVPELAGTYPPPLRLDPINAAMDDLRNKNKQEVSPSDLMRRLQQSKGNRITPREIKGGALFKDQVPGLPMDAGPAAAPKPGDPAAPTFEPDHLLVRFVDPDVRPGLTYEYQIRIRMKNPNFKQPTEVSNPSYADHEILYGPWTQISDQVYVPNESFLYGYDTAKYSDEMKKLSSDAAMQRALQPGPNQAVMQVQTWMEQVRAEGSSTREPVGAWVIAEMPVSRGEYIGRKQFLKLPLWSAEAGKFIMRAVPAATLGLRLGKDKEPPHGWLVNFKTESILVDFEGGKVAARVGSRTVSDEAATEILVVRPDGRLLVKNSAEDMKDPDRAERNTAWNKWVQEVEARKESSSGAGTNDFIKPKSQ